MAGCGVSSSCHGIPDLCGAVARRAPSSRCCQAPPVLPPQTVPCPLGLPAGWLTTPTLRQAAQTPPCSRARSCARGWSLRSRWRRGAAAPRCAGPRSRPACGTGEMPRWEGSDPGWPRLAVFAPLLPAQPLRCASVGVSACPAQPSPSSTARCCPHPRSPLAPLPPPPREPQSFPRPAHVPPALPPLSSITPSWAATARRAPTAPWQSTSGGGTCTAPTWRRSRRTTRRRAAPSPWL